MSNHVSKNQWYLQTLFVKKEQILCLKIEVEQCN